VGRPDQVPTFASFFPETAIEEFDRAQRRDEHFALRMIEQGIATSFAPYGMTRDLTIFVGDGLTALGEREAKRRALPDCGLRPDPATVALDDPAYRREPDAGAGELLVGM
jgi:hypothetical protein